MAAITPLDETHLEAICEVLGSTDKGLTGSQIGRYLKDSKIPDPEPEITKKRRLFSALKQKQRLDRCANNILAFVKRVMSPALYHDRIPYYNEFRALLNVPFAFSGYQVNERGEIVPVSAARTLPEAEQRASKLRNELTRRQVHPDVLTFCRAELLKDNYFHAVLEATKSVSEKIRQRTGLTGDAGDLAQTAFSLGQSGVPFLAFNTLQTDTEKSEQKGLANLFVGMFGTFRNTTGHAPRVHWNLSEQDALDLLTIVSFLHRRLDAAAKTGRPLNS